MVILIQKKGGKIKRVEIGLGWNREGESSGLPSIPQGPEQGSTSRPDTPHGDLELCRVRHGKHSALETP